MFNIRFNSRSLAFLTSGVFTFSLCGCSSSKSNDNNLSNYVSSNTVVTDFVTTGVEIPTVALDPVTDNVKEYSYDSDSLVLNYYDGIISDKDDESFFEKGKRYFIYSVDFLFYDSEIGGIKFSDLTSSAKEQLLHDIVTIDDLICSKFPNYKENISDGMGNVFNKVMQIVRAGCKNINDFSRDKLGEDDYNKIVNFKNLFFETAFGDWNKFTGAVNNGKQKVKDWYEDFRNSSSTQGLK